MLLLITSLRMGRQEPRQILRQHGERAWSPFECILFFDKAPKILILRFEAIPGMY